MSEMAEIGAAIIAITVLLAFVAYADKVTDDDEEERKHKDDDQT